MIEKDSSLHLFSLFFFEFDVILQYKQQPLNKRNTVMKVYTANYYEWDNCEFLGVFSTSEKAIDALKKFYEETSEENNGLKCDYVVAELTMDEGTKNEVTATLEEIEKYGNKFEK